MKPRAGALALLVLLAACGSSAASSSTPSASPSSASGTSSPVTTPAPAAGHCGPRGATTLAASSRARVYSWHGSVYGCSFSRGRAFRLGSMTRSIRESRVAPVAVAGNIAAYGLASFGVDRVSAAVDVRRLTDGKYLRNLPVTRTGVVEGIDTVGSLVVRADGSVAWIGVARSIVAHRQATEVHAASASAPVDKVLDAGAQIAADSLRLHGSTLTWRHGTGTRHATLG